MRRLLWTAVLALVIVPVAFGQLGSSKSGDHRVKKALDELGLKYTIDSDGDFKLTFEFEDGRSQLCFINSGTETFKLFEIREVWAPAYKTDGPFTATVANKLLEDSFKKKLGAWQTMVGSDGSHLAVFAAKIDANCDAQSLHACIKAVVSAADDMEEELTGTKDEY
ncbi:MAG: hypothetical protein ABIK44_02130 [candidate division WOR-3 bacterium]